MHTTVRSPDDADAGRYTATETRFSVLWNAQLQVDDRVIAVRVSNISTGGMLIRIPEAIAQETRIAILLRGAAAIAGRIAWTRDKSAGIAFDQAIDPLRLLARDDASHADRDDDAIAASVAE